MKQITKSLVKAGFVAGNLTPAESVAKILLSDDAKFVAEGERVIASFYPEFRNEVKRAMRDLMMAELADTGELRFHPDLMKMCSDEELRENVRLARE